MFMLRKSELWANEMSSVRPRRWLSRLFAAKEEKKAVSPYHAVAIRCAGSACQAALDIQYERFISAEAPMLPLFDCDRPGQCQCRYQHYEDRRVEDRRGAGHAAPIKNDSARVERRSGKGRRADDNPEGEEPFSVSEDSYYGHVEDTIRTAQLDPDEADGVDPYNSGSFDKSNSWKSSSQ